ncbi:hypothetical protein [Nitrospirillum amazonense]|uniref:hypothetical protein n=1 Tax=Nitrospirillum amazonense TaxID=28077 RepID=UPI0011A62E70|nr:hypothetical protein [Nitrospirillum amazonense]
MSEDIKFLPGCVQGYYTYDELDDFIDQWHDSDSVESLVDYLGFSQGEWEILLMDKSALQKIISARDEGVPIGEYIAKKYAMAARSDKPAEAQKIIDWLKKNGHI